MTNTPHLSIDTRLLPQQNPAPDLFICDVADAVLKDVMQQMEHPFYALSKKPETAIRRYEHHGCYVEITPSVKGMATIYDKDILIYCISQIMAKLRQGEPVSKRLRINSYDLLQFTQRGTAGKDYTALSEAIDRLAGTRIATNIKTGDEERYENFGLIDAASIRRKNGLDGRLLWCEITLSDWVFNAIHANEVLTLHPDYFRLSKPLERRIYELARKHCGHQPSWTVSLTVLLKKSGSQSQMKRFKQMVKGLAYGDHLPDYHVRLDEARDHVIFTNREAMPPIPDRESPASVLHASTYEAARQVAPGWDVYMLEQEWRAWMVEPPVNPGKAFVGFCRKWVARRGIGSAYAPTPTSENRTLHQTRLQGWSEPIG